MSSGPEKNNRVYLCGLVAGDPVYSHSFGNEKLYEFFLRVDRFSDQADLLPITASESILSDKVKAGKKISVFGQFRSYNKEENGKSRLMLTVFAKDILDDIGAENPNSIILTGCVCKQPVYRTTPFNREIADILIAVNRTFTKSDYIPAIAWGRNARFAKNLLTGDKISLCGRIQSRKYRKKQPDETYRSMTAYEVSVTRMFVYDEESEFNPEAEYDLLTACKDPGSIFKYLEEHHKLFEKKEEKEPPKDE